MTTTPIRRPPIPAAGPLSTAGLTTVLLGLALPLLDFFIVNVALPTIDADLGASTATLELLVAGYGTAYALLLVLGGRLGDAFGRRRLFLAGLAAFTLTSLLCGLAPTVEALVAARIAQGASAAMLMPQVLSVIQAGTTGERRSKALGRYGAAGGISMVAGQLLGGLLIHADLAGSGWRPIFLVNVPIGLVGLLIARRTIPESRSAHPLGVDVRGTALFGVAMLALLVPLLEGRALGWPGWMWVLLAVFPLAMAGFVVTQRRSERAGQVPLLPPSVLRSPGLARGLLLASPFFAAFSGLMFAFAVATQDGLGLGALGSGVALSPMALGFLVSSLVSSRLVARYGTRVITYGTGLQAFGMVVLAVTTLLAWPDLGVLEFAPGMLLTGLGQGAGMTTVFRVVLARVPADRAGVGSGALTTVQQTSMALGVAAFGTLFAAAAEPGALGMRNAFVLIMTIQAVTSLALSVFSVKLPDPR
ncbi:MFS transporter [Amycolatopsis albispora]|uniref:MFS transporter n=1 Tax=Amycolatopsis albispora TaxID=1804986 RepID=A0A344LD61_9PSEU|nr:MFS transporter [Amycolatopsis albispora]AXB45985.1 MFS transporter [Amycolatopsis albispora]